MRFKWMGVVALLGFLSAENFSEAWAQSLADKNSTWNTQPAQVAIVPERLTMFERYDVHADQPLVTVSFPAISTEVAPHVLLSLTPVALAPFDAPDALQLLAVEFRLSQTSLPASGIRDSQSHAVSTLLDWDELPALRSLFNALSATGMPRTQFSEAKTRVRLATKRVWVWNLQTDPGSGFSVRLPLTRTP